MEDEDQGITAYHGSPHDFVQFDIGQIGTGEGAQAYGRGLYFAEDEGVARSYRDALAQKYDPRDAISDVVHQFRDLRVQNPTYENVKSWMSDIPSLKQHYQNENIVRRVHEIINATDDDEAFYAYKELDHLLPAPSKGHMYEVNINAHPDHFLDWDKPFNEQSDYVRDSLINWNLADSENHKDSTGKKIYHRTGGISELLGRENEDPRRHAIAVAKLANAGIKGIKYLDQGSRPAGEGSRNYVVFDDKLVNVKRKYEQGGEVKKLLQDKYPTHYMPNVGRQVMADGGETAQPGRDVSPLGFYSHAAETAQNFPQAKGTPDQFRSMLLNSGVKPAEIEHSGYDEAFADKPSVTREDVAQHFRERMPQIEETVLGGKEPFDGKRLDELEQQYNSLKLHPIDDPSFGEEKYDEMIRLMNVRDQSSTKSLYDAADSAMYIAQQAQRRGDKETAKKYFREYELLNVRAEKLDLEGLGLPNPTKYQDYTLPGGNNYREVLLKLPSSPKPEVTEKYGRFGFTAPDGKYREYWSKAEAEQAARSYYRESGDFTSTHWNEPNVLAHLRMSDRTGPNGEKILHLEELQSDWGQEGKKEGFKGQNALTNEEREEFQRLNSMPYRARTPNEDDRLEKLYLRLKREKSVLPSAPYVTSTQGWTDLGLKRVLKEAAEGGYDKVVWTPGVEQAKRYNLSDHIDEIKYMRNADNTYNVYPHKDGEEILTKLNMKPSEVEDLVGREIAKKMFATPDPEGAGYIFYNALTGDRSERYPTEEAAKAARDDFRSQGVKGSLIIAQVPAKNPMQSISGVDLSVGGEGMKGYYDKIVPKALQKLVSKHDKDAKVGIKGSLPGKDGNSVPAMGIDITPKMRESIMRGQSAFADGGEVPPAAGPIQRRQIPVSQSPIVDRALMVSSRSAPTLPGAPFLSRQLRGRPVS